MEKEIWQNIGQIKLKRRKPERRASKIKNNDEGGFSDVAKKYNDYGTGIPRHEVEALARVLLPSMQEFFASEEGQREYAEWEAEQATSGKRSK